jgi:hypothetical protein
VHKTVNLMLQYVGTVAAITTAFTPEIVRISDIGGKLMVEKLISTGATSAKIAVNLKSGIYIVEIYGNALLRTSEKMIIY